MERCLQEFRIRGVKTNIPFLLNLVTHPKFLAGEVTTRFLDETPELFQFPRARTAPAKLLSYIAEIIVNGHPEVRGKAPAMPRTSRPCPAERCRIRFPIIRDSSEGDARSLQANWGTRSSPTWVREQKQLLVTDTTMRDAPPVAAGDADADRATCSRIADRYARMHAGLFSLEMWGGATFDTAMRFLKESPWDRLARLREQIPNILFQMLLRAASAVGYTNYPDNVVVRVRPARRPRRGWTSSASSTPTTGCRTSSSAIDAVLKTNAHLRGRDLLHRRHPRSEARQVHAQLLRESREGTREARHALPRHQGHGRAAQAVRGEEAGEGTP